MLAFLIRRLAFALLLVFVVASAALWLTRLTPGDMRTRMALEAPEAERAVHCPLSTVHQSETVSTMLP